MPCVHFASLRVVLLTERHLRFRLPLDAVAAVLPRRALPPLVRHPVVPALLPRQPRAAGPRGQERGDVHPARRLRRHVRLPPRRRRFLRRRRRRRRRAVQRHRGRGRRGRAPLFLPLPPHRDVLVRAVLLRRARDARGRALPRVVDRAVAIFGRLAASARRLGDGRDVRGIPRHVSLRRGRGDERGRAFHGVERLRERREERGLRPRRGRGRGRGRGRVVPRGVVVVVILLVVIVPARLVPRRRGLRFDDDLPALVVLHVLHVATVGQAAAVPVQTEERHDDARRGVRRDLAPR
eukprot:30831-Pelagococcus_subviridis.AAC.11